MALIENTLLGTRNKISIAIERLQMFEPPEGYYLAFSGGKDSQCIYHLAVAAGVKFDAHYNITGIDPPELVYFIRKYYPDVERHMPQHSMYKLMEKKGLPTRQNRFCCENLKEHGGEGRVCITGVRKAESAKRNTRTPFEIVTTKKFNKILLNDNDDARQMFENCEIKGKRVVNPIIDWLDEDVWEYMHMMRLKYCELYDQGFSRLGCIGCPLTTTENRLREFKRWPKFEANYMRAIERFLPGYLQRCEKKGRTPYKTTAQEWMDWWIYGSEKDSEYPLLDLLEEE